MDIIFSTREYEYEHGCLPKGRGWWFFTFEDLTFQYTGTFGEAKKACRKYIHQIAPHGYLQTIYVNIEP